MFSRGGYHERSAIDYPRKKARKNSWRIGHLSICADPNCNIVSRSCCLEEIRMNHLPLFKGLSYFEISHHEYCKDVFVEIERKGQKHTRSLRKHPTHKETASLCNDLKQAEDVPMPVARRGRPRSKQDIENDTFPDVHETPLDRIYVNTSESISDLSNSPSESAVFAPQRMTTKNKN